MHTQYPSNKDGLNKPQFKKQMVQGPQLCACEHKSKKNKVLHSQKHYGPQKHFKETMSSLRQSVWNHCSEATSKHATDCLQVLRIIPPPTKPRRKLPPIGLGKLYALQRKFPTNALVHSQSHTAPFTNQQAKRIQNEITMKKREGER